jgi:4-hydroxy-tetrahydrodipicolinate synthase
MPRFKNYIPHGVIPALLLPFKESDLSIDEEAYRQHVRFVSSTKGISTIMITGQSQEASALTFEEQKRVIAITMEEVGDRLPVVPGVYADCGREAARLGRLAEQEGASGLLVFPPAPFVRGSQMRPEMAIAHFKSVADATDLPMIAFQYELASGQGYLLETLIRLAQEIPTFAAIKDRSNNPVLHERHIRTLQNLPRPVNVLTTHSAWLMASLVLGCNGLLSGSGSFIADLQVALWEAVQNNDLKRARHINDRIYPLASVFYSEPLVDMHNRMKEALVMLGRFPSAACRLPWVRVSAKEREHIRLALQQAGVRPDGSL